ncbi:MAG: hypothetical protein ABMA14_07760 [Hyphomonadaceae bacterium]
MKTPTLPVLCIALAVVAGAIFAGLWLVDQAAFFMTTDARVPARLVTLSSEIAGQIVDMPANAGDRISAPWTRQPALSTRW